MNLLKGLALGLLSFLLFLSLFFFGLAFTIDQTVLNPRFLIRELDRIDVSSLVEETISEQSVTEDFPEELHNALIDTITKLEPLIKEETGAAAYPVYDYIRGKSQSLDLALALKNTFFNSDFIATLIDRLDLPSLTEQIISEPAIAGDFPEEFNTALVNTVVRLEPLIKEQVIATTDPIFDYLLGESQSLNLTATLRNTILNSGFIASLVDELDVSNLAAEYYGDQLTGQIPEEMEFLTGYLDDAVKELEPTIKEELKAAAAPIADYLLGESQVLNVVIPLESLVASLEEPLRESFESLLPEEYAGLSQSQLDQLFDDYFAQLAAIIPATLVLDESLLGTEIPAQITEAIDQGESALQQLRQDISDTLTEAEKGLALVKPYVGYFLLGYRLSIGFIILLILGIILINRQVKDICRNLGIIFLTYGALEFAGTFIAKYIFRNQLTRYDIPVAIQGLPEQVFSDFLSPLLFLSLGLLITGAVLTIVSFVYKPRQSLS